MSTKSLLGFLIIFQLILITGAIVYSMITHIPDPAGVAMVVGVFTIGFSLAAHSEME